MAQEPTEVELALAAEQALCKNGVIDNRSVRALLADIHKTLEDILAKP